MEPTTEGRHDGRGCDPGYGPRPDGVETEDKADPYEIGKRPLKVSKVSKQGEHVDNIMGILHVAPPSDYTNASSRWHH